MTARAKIFIGATAAIGIVVVAMSLPALTQ
jgi:hypothetical protein